MANWNQNPDRYRGFPKTVREQALRKIDYHCARCGDTANLELDHVIGRSVGGTNTIDNAQWLCPRCHSVKTREEARAGTARRTARGRHPTEQHPGLL
jgi:5-methylcytosine-specific restriction endonuclease McrA